MGRSSKDKRDIFYRLAKEEGWRARSAYKLLHLDRELKLLENVTRAVDLCSAPGSWSQVLAQAMKPLENPGKCIVSVDLQEVAPIPGVHCFSGDITFGETADKIIELLGDSQADIVVCDGAPDVTGYHVFDEHLQSDLFMAALKISLKVLAPNGTFLAKIFRSSEEGEQWLFSNTQIFFRDVMIAKPRSSRSSSVEAYIVGRQFSPPINFTGLNSEEILPEKQAVNGTNAANALPQTICGSEGLESDTDYPPAILEGHKYEFSVPPPNLKVMTDGYSLGYEPPAKIPGLPSYEEALLARNTRKLNSLKIKPNENDEAAGILASTNTRRLNISFGGGADNLVSCGKEITLDYSESEHNSFELRGVINYIKDNFIVERPELFVKDDDIRPGILVLINDTDWEILDKLDYEVQEGDSIAFISTLHGG